MIATEDLARAVFMAGLPRGPKGAPVPGHTTWDQLGSQAKDRAHRMAQAVIDTLKLDYQPQTYCQPNATEFWHCYATPWVRTCTCDGSKPDGWDPRCPIHPDGW